MGKMTAGQVLTQVDSLLPNAYTREEKLRWLLQAEGTIIREVLQPVDRAGKTGGKHRAGGRDAL